MSTELKESIQVEVKAAMRAKDKQRLGALRLISAEIKRVEVDERIEVDDAGVLGILDKMAKQRRDSLNQFKEAGRDDLVAQEQFELDLLAEFMPEQLSEAELEAIVARLITQLGATGMQDMGKVMGAIKSEVQGQADMGLVGKIVKTKLAAS